MNFFATCAVWTIDGSKTEQITKSCDDSVTSSKSGFISGTYCSNLSQAKIGDKMGIEMAEELTKKGAKEILGN